MLVFNCRSIADRTGSVFMFHNSLLFTILQIEKLGKLMLEMLLVMLA